jgi:hypothetical protein
MHLAHSFIVLSCAGLVTACGTDFAIAVHPAPTQSGDASTPPMDIPDAPPACSSVTISGRVQRSRIRLSEGVRYRRAEPYFYGYPQDERIALAPWGSEGRAMVAWLNAGGTDVHVTLLTPQLERLPEDLIDLDDYVVPGTELSGLVAHDDGFAVLTRRLDPGEPIGPGTPPARMQAAHLVRWALDRREVFARPLTGTFSIVTGVPENERRDHPEVTPTSIGLSGRLAHNGTNYAAYFTSEGGVRDRFAGMSSDKLVQVDDSGNYVSSWRAAGCRQSLGGRIVPELDGFTVFCMSDGALGESGIYAVERSGGTRFLAPQVAPAAGDYLGGNLGAALKTPSGYLVAWASRGIDTGTGNYVFEPHEPATMAISNALVRVGTTDWPFLPDNARPKQDAVNVHAVPYGDKVLLVWETIDTPQFRGGAGYGIHGGTHFQLVDHQGTKATEEDYLPDAVAPNGQDDIVQFPNKDIGWAYVREVERNFQLPAAAANPSNLPTIKEIHFVRIPHCP